MGAHHGTGHGQGSAHGALDGDSGEQRGWGGLKTCSRHTRHEAMGEERASSTHFIYRLTASAEHPITKVPMGSVLLWVTSERNNKPALKTTLGSCRASLRDPPLWAEGTRRKPPKPHCGAAETVMNLECNGNGYGLGQAPLPRAKHTRRSGGRKSIPISFQHTSNPAPAAQNTREHLLFPCIARQVFLWQRESLQKASQTSRY